MISLNLDILSIRMGNRHHLEDGKLKNHRSISFDVIPSEDDCLELETGEVFSNNRRRWREGDKPNISGQLNVNETSDEETFKETFLIYRGGFTSEHDYEMNHNSFLSFYIFLGSGSSSSVIG